MQKHLKFPHMGRLHAPLLVLLLMVGLGAQISHANDKDGLWFVCDETKTVQG